MNPSFIVVLVTAKDRVQAGQIARVILKDKLAACANIVDGVESLFWWEGKIDHAKETLLILKTKKSLFRKLAARIKTVHSYQTPEIIALPIVAGSADYLGWMNKSLA